MSDEQTLILTFSELPKAWADLLRGLKIMSGAISNEISPFHCEHDELWVMADPAQLSEEQILDLEELGFVPGDDGCFISSRFGSA